jgi:hypothetical protein
MERESSIAATDGGGALRAARLLGSALSNDGATSRGFDSSRCCEAKKEAPDSASCQVSGERAESFDRGLSKRTPSRASHMAEIFGAYHAALVEIENKLAPPLAKKNGSQGI